jgi:hypothetical protein
MTRQMIVVMGLSEQRKRDAVNALVAALTPDSGVTVLDNGGLPLGETGAPTLRFSGGCICCELAYKLIKVLPTLKSEVVLLNTSPFIDPPLMRQTLANACGEGWTTRVIALLESDPPPIMRYMSERMREHADMVLREDAPLGEVVDAALRLPL